MISVYVLKRSDTLSRPHQVMLFWAGLRGAVAFALAAGLDGVKEEAALKTTILVVVVLSVIVFGGTTARMLAILGVKMNCVDSEGESEEEDNGAGDDYYDRDRDREIYLAEDVYGRGSDNQALYLQSSYSNSELSLQSRPSDDEYVGGGGSGSSGSSTGSAPERGGPYGHHSHHSHHQYQRDIMPLPVASANHPDDTHWFLSFDDRYLKPIFSRSRQWNRSRRKFSGPTLQHQHRSHRAAQQTLGASRTASGASGMTTATGGRHSRFASSNGAATNGAANTVGSYLNSHGSNSNLVGTFNTPTGVGGGGVRRSSSDLMGDELGMSHVRRELDRRAASAGSHHGSTTSLNNLGSNTNNSNNNGSISGKIHDI